VVILSEDGGRFAHTQGAPVRTGSVPLFREPAPPPYGPEIAFRYAFPRPGLYKVWGQFTTRSRDVITADFVVRAY
jgi:hypothetical protein